MPDRIVRRGYGRPDARAGVGDVVVGKQMGKQMAVLGGRLGALRKALPDVDDSELIAVIERNLTLVENGDPASMANALRSPLGAAY